MKRVLKKSTLNGWLLALAFIIFFSSFHEGGLKTALYPYLREIQYHWILFKTRELSEIETEHFRIRYEGEDQEVINLVARASERHYKDICDLFDYYPERKTMVIVYDDAMKLMANANLGHGKPPMGVYYASTVQILSPRLWVKNPQGMEEIFLNEGPMVHEFTHLLVDDIARGNYPLWFTEGMALYQEYVQTGYEWGKNLEYPEGKPYTIEELTNSFHQLDEMLAYKRSFEIVREIIETYGFQDMNQVLRNLGKGYPLAEAKKEAFQIDVLNLYP
ncbi:MAG: hypothetical protein AB2421_12340 [Thermotaleaceae bacterium]